jgi:cytochrome c-type biogenesis protein CcmH
MTIFWIICALLIVVALLFVVLPLWRRSTPVNTVMHNTANLEIFRDQITEMDNDLKNGLLTQELYDQGKRELQARLLDEVKEDQVVQVATARNPLKVLSICLAIFLPIASGLLYWKIGNPDALSPQASLATMGGSGTMRSPESVAALEAKVAKNPDDGESLLMLARAYGEMERFADSANTYGKLTQSVTDEAWIWADYADVLAMAQGQSLAGPPTKLIEKALAIDPNFPKALALAGSAAMERGDYAAAVRNWEHLLKGLPAESEDAKMIMTGLQQARQFLAQSKGGKGMMLAQAEPAPEVVQPSAASGKERISGSVTISAAMKSKVSPTDTVFVLARAAQGPKMPLAIMRKQVQDLPLQFSLDDSMAMAPQMKLSNFDEVVIVVRVSKSGTAMPQSGDLQGMSSPVKPGSSGLKINIDTMVP